MEHHRQESSGPSSSAGSSVTAKGRKGRRHQAQKRAFQNDTTAKKETPPTPIAKPEELIPKTALEIIDNKGQKLWKIPAEAQPLPQDGMVAQVHFKSWLVADKEKKIIDSSSSSDSTAGQVGQQPFEFVIGKGQVSRAIDEGVKTMRNGEKAQFIYRRSEEASGSVNASLAAKDMDKDKEGQKNEELVCTEVELVNILDQPGKPEVCVKKGSPGMVMKEMIEIQEDGTTMDGNVIVFVTLTGYHHGKVFFPRATLPFNPKDNSWGSNKADRIFPATLPNAIKSMRNGEKALVSLSGSSAMRVALEDKPQKIHVPVGAPIRFLVEIEEVDKLIDPKTVALGPSMDSCVDLLQKGNTYKDQGHADAALSKFVRAEELMQNQSFFGAQLLLYATLKDLADLHGKTDKMDRNRALSICNKAIGMENSLPFPADKVSCKIHMRRGIIRMEQRKYTLAKRDFEKALLLAVEGEEEDLASEALILLSAASQHVGTRRSGFNWLDD